MTDARPPVPSRLRGVLAAARRDDGAMSLFVLVTIVGLFAVAALVIDGGGKLRALSHAEGVAQEAARAGGQAIDAGKAISGQGITVDRNAAVAAARSYLSAAGASGTVTVSDDGASLKVTVSETYSPKFLPGGDWSVSGRASADLVYRG
ncbi:pilus assembly protein TadG-related protein [Streptomyces sp. NPDC001407]|uniref:pilus assembly protein TadG-related protein n=1 Tax=Streptomyces sp. NPDC001407 TaxID=3364573 RepID=UPI0036CB02EE